MPSEAIQDRTGRTIPQSLIDKAQRIADSGGVKAMSTGWLYQVTGDTDTYLVAITSVGEAACRCRWGRETDSLCSHVVAVKIHSEMMGQPVHINKIDGSKLTVVDDVPDDPFEGL